MKTTIIVLLTAAILIIAGCTISGNSTADLDGVQCDSPYISHGNECCLDKNDNNVCDVDETQKVETTVVRERPIILVEETCSMPRFTCLSKEITEDYVRLMLRFDRDEIINIKSIDLKELGCKKDFEDLELRYNDEFEVKIPCVINEEAIKTSILTEADITRIIKHSNGQVFDHGTPTGAEIKGEIGGIVEQ